MVRKAWGPGNPLWEWKRKHGKIHASKKAARRPRRGGKMSRYGRHKKGHKQNPLMRIARRGMFPLGAGIFGALAVGALVGYAQKKGMIPNVGFGVIPASIEPHVVPLAAGGIPGALAAMVVKGGLGTSSGDSSAAPGY